MGGYRLHSKYYMEQLNRKREPNEHRKSSKFDRGTPYTGALFKIKNWMEQGKKKYLIQGQKGKSLTKFVKWEKKGSKCFRDIMTKNSRIEQGKNLIKLPQVKTFLRLVGTQNIESI